ncbi:fasciclin domain-containing protein [Calothrix membranacea FACHB-236]|nr:fasciclin domain-containing protein [Calothrix membranacea FACHB-236]
MKTQNFATSIKKFACFTTGILLIPVVAACAPNETAQVPNTVTPEAVPTTPTTSPAIPNTTVNEDIQTVVQTNPSLTTLTNLINEANLTDQLGAGPYTLFAPSDEAFAALPDLTRQRLSQPENRELLRQVLAYHVVPGNLTANQLQSKEVNTLGNNPVTIQADQTNNEVRVNDARVIQPDIPASNGVIHIVDRVILPPTIQ